MTGVGVLEYLGQNTEGDKPIRPSVMGDCPFTSQICKKLKSKDKKKPVCSVRDSKGKVYVVCSERLCSSAGEKLTEHQRDVLYQTARAVFGDIQYDEVLYKKEVSFKMDGQRPRADFVLAVLPKSKGADIRKVVVEFQGGGETSNTGAMTRHVDGWEKDANPTNDELRQRVDKVAPIVNNAWKRQLDQLVLKGSIASRTGYRFVLCVGEYFADYIYKRVRRESDLRKGGWNFAILPFSEVKSSGLPIKFRFNEEYAFYTTVNDFLTNLMGRGAMQQDPFDGDYTRFDGSVVTFPTVLN